MLTIVEFVGNVDYAVTYNCTMELGILIRRLYKTGLEGPRVSIPGKQEAL